MCVKVSWKESPYSIGMLEEAIICLSIFVGGFFILPENIQKTLLSKRYALYTCILSIILYILSIFLIRFFKKNKENFDGMSTCGTTGKRCDDTAPYCLVTEMALPTNDLDQTIVFNTFGRYVKIFPPESSGDGYVNFSVLHIFDATGNNILTGKTAVTGASHSQTTNPSGQAYKVGNNGKIIRYWPDVFHAPGNDRNTAVWTVDLGRIYMITKIRYIGRGDCCDTINVDQRPGPSNPVRNLGLRFRIYSDPADVPTTGKCTSIPTIDYPYGTTDAEKIIIRPIILKGIDGGMALNMYRGLQSDPGKLLTAYGLSDKLAAQAYSQLQSTNNRMAFSGWNTTGTWSDNSTKVNILTGCMPVIGQTVHSTDAITIYEKSAVDTKANCHYGYLSGDGIDGYINSYNYIFANVPTVEAQVSTEYILPEEKLKQTITNKFFLGGPDKGRYIRIRPSLSSGDGNMQISQIVVKNGNTILSQGKPVRYSSTKKENVGANISSIVDGTLGERAWPDVWISNTADRASQYVEIDLGSTQTITSIDYYSRNDGFTERNSGLRIQVLDFFKYQKVFMVQDGPLVKISSEDGQFARSLTGKIADVNKETVATYKDEYGNFKYTANPSYVNCSAGEVTGSGFSSATSNAKKVYGITAGAKVTAINGRSITLDKPTTAAGNNITISFNGYIDQTQLNRLNRSLQTVRSVSDFPASLNKGDIIRVFKNHNTSGGTTYAKDIDGNPILGADKKPVSVPFVDDGSKAALYSILNVVMPSTGDPSAGNSANVTTPTADDRSKNYNVPGPADTSSWIATALQDVNTPPTGVSNPKPAKKTYGKNDQLDITGINTYDSSQQDLTDLYAASLATGGSNTVTTQNERTIGNRTQYAEIMILGDSSTFSNRADAQAACESILGTLVSAGDLSYEFSNMNPYLKRPQWHEYGWVSDSDTKYLVTQELSIPSLPLGQGSWSWSPASGEGSANGVTNITKTGGLLGANVSTGAATCRAIKSSKSPQAKTADKGDAIQEINVKTTGRYVRVWVGAVGYAVRDAQNKNSGESCDSGYKQLYDNGTKKFCVSNSCPDSSYTEAPWLKSVCVNNVRDTICLNQVVVKNKEGRNVSYGRWDYVKIVGGAQYGDGKNLVDGTQSSADTRFISGKYLACPPGTKPEKFSEYGDGSQAGARCQQDVYWQLDLGTSTYVSTITLFGCSGQSVKGLRVEVSKSLRPKPYRDSIKHFAWNDLSAFNPPCNLPLVSKICADPDTKVPGMMCVMSGNGLDKCPGDCDPGTSWCSGKSKCIPNMYDLTYWKTMAVKGIDKTQYISADGSFDQGGYNGAKQGAIGSSKETYKSFMTSQIMGSIFPKNCRLPDKKTCGDFYAEGDVWGRDCWDDGVSLWHKTGQVCGDACWLGWDSCRRKGAFGECWGGCRESCSPVGVLWKTIGDRAICHGDGKVITTILGVKTCCDKIKPETCTGADPVVPFSSLTQLLGFPMPDDFSG